MKSVLYSLKHSYAEYILDGKKKCELRTSPAHIPAPYKIYLYDGATSGGCGMVTGECVAQEIVKHTLKKFNDVETMTLAINGFIEAKQLFNYASKSHNTVYEIKLREVKRYDKPKPISDFYIPQEDGTKKVVTKPPQNYCYVCEREENG